ncbi:hypothetical protein Tco_1015578 [Tanacetum coccineum]|uniref:Reverse transcriptase domain-containing protein n=1 Tax=Tanacetum coccineum TaxID=301880 RepID=A0ABQ5FMI8_9ASTR
MNQNLSNSNSSGFDQFQPPQYPVIHHSPQETSEEVLQAREDLMKTIQTFLRKFSRIHFGEMPKVLLVAWERFSEFKHAFTDKQYQQEDIQELMSKLLEDVRNINEELFEFINRPSWNRLTFYNDDDEYTVIYRKPKEITPDLPIEEPDNSLTMRDEHLNTISETEKTSVENLVPMPSEFKGISEDICDVPSCDHFDAECGLINSLLSRDKEGIDNDILQIEDEILREKLLNANLLVDKIKALKLTSFIPFVLENPSSSPIPVVDSDFLIEEVDTFLVSEDSIPPGIESDLDSEGDIVFLDNLLNEDPIPEYERFTFDFKADAPVINNLMSLMKMNVLTQGEDCPDFEDSRVHGTDIKEMDKIKAKTDKAEHEKERVHKSQELSSYGQQKTGRDLIDVYVEELTLRHDDEAVTFKVGQTSRYFYNDAESINRIDVIDVACGSMLKNDFLLEETDVFLAIGDDSISPEINDSYYDSEGDIRLLEEFLNDDPSPPLPPKELHVEELKIIKSSIDDHPELELMDLPSHLEYAFLEGTDKLPVIIAKDLKEDEKVRLLKVLKSYKHAIAWKISDIKGIDPQFCTPKILMEDDSKQEIQH